MVSNSLHMPLDELLAEIQRMRKQGAGDAEYTKMCAELPEDWPL
jgi:hypothetical protein